MLVLKKHKYMEEAAAAEAGGAGGATGAAAPAAPPVAPDVPTAPEAQPAAPAKEPEAGKATYEKSGDPGLDFAIDFVSGLGIAADDPAYKAAEQGNFDLLRVKLATMGDKARGFEAVLAVAEKAYESLASDRDAKVTARAELVHQEAGGEQEWAAVREWAKQAAEPAEKAEINAMLNGGPIAAKAAVQYLKSMYSAASGTSNPPAKAVPASAGAGGAGGRNGPMSPTDYKAAVQELSRKLGPRIDESPEYRVLQSRRQAWRG